MIIVNLIGGLGNQMFQYACARSLSTELKMQLKATVDMFDIYKSHNGSELERVFSIELDYAQPAELRHMIGTMRTFKVLRRVLGIKPFASLRGKHFVVEPHYRYWDGLLDRARAGGYLQGYWQSEKYFDKHISTIRNDFAFRQPPSRQNAKFASDILNSVAVSIHIRRGDYVNNAKTFANHGVCLPEYYFKAIEVMRQRVPESRFFAFSDDPKWVAEVLIPRCQGLVLVDHNQAQDSYNDMRLMSLCKHHIIANSSFSWWGAWLNPNPDKIVIAPHNWFANDKDSTDLIPETYIRL